ncbi:outer membrane beta-barrel protein [Seonamhaeicola sp. ML3]|uniref:outer membrane beta-barrel protein n=1 Tax=Seonamhaeicola sp. ML3 TaxID=2937786 RepID=UPI00200BE583|nr:outer membrane beta-barrel family protein [Seonamhaeicola sp. ML3]
MLKRLLALSFVLFCLNIFSQDFVLQGIVQDEQNNAVAFSNVALLKENTIISGTTSLEDGKFKIENLKAATYTIKISFLGYKTHEQQIDLNSDLDLKTIVLKENLQSLEGVTIVAKRPTVKRMVDRLVFTVENSTLSNDNTLELLSHTPGVLVYDNKITIKNTPPTIYINDRRVHLSAEEVVQLLESTPANNIKSVEVITNPPAKYDAEGGAVLNIITSKNIISGYSGSIFANYKQGSQFPKFALGTSHFFKAKKLNTYLNYSISPRKDFIHNTESINFINSSGNIFSSWETSFKRTQETSNQNISTTITYDFDEDNSLKLSSIVLIAPRKVTRKTSNSSTEIFNTNGVLDSIFNTFNPRVDETYNIAINLDYVHKFKKPGEELTFNIHHTNYDTSNFQNVDTDYLFPDNSLIRTNKFQTFSSQVIKLNTSQVDYSLPLPNSASLETGVKFANIDSDNIIDQFLFKDDEREEDLENSDIFSYDETSFAGYISLSKDWESWSIKAGIRGEYTDTEGFSRANNEASINNYFNLFPSLYIVNRIGDNNEIYFNYNRRIYRPRYSQLNPFRYFLNDNTYTLGDPNLLPQIDDIITLGYTFNRDYTFELYYRYEKNPAIQFILQDNINNALIYKYTNTDVSYSFGLDFTTYTQIAKDWSLYVLSSVYYYNNRFFAPDDDTVSLSAEQWTVYAEVVNYFNLLKDKSLTANISYILLSPTNDGPTDTSEMHGLNINLRKALWNNKASLSIGVQDVFNTQNFTARARYLNQDSFLRSRLENRLFTVGFNYKFGNRKLKNNKAQLELEERDRLD